jgi:hypothetical protein
MRRLVLGVIDRYMFYLDKDVNNIRFSNNPRFFSCFSPIYCAFPREVVLPTRIPESSQNLASLFPPNVKAHTSAKNQPGVPLHFLTNTLKQQRTQQPSPPQTKCCTSLQAASLFPTLHCTFHASLTHKCLRLPSLPAAHPLVSLAARQGCIPQNNRIYHIFTFQYSNSNSVSDPSKGTTVAYLLKPRPRGRHGLARPSILCCKSTCAAPVGNPVFAPMGALLAWGLFCSCCMSGHGHGLTPGMFSLVIYPLCG